MGGKEPVVDLVIISYNTLAYLRNLIASINQHTTLPHAVIVVDNNSSDGSRRWLTHNKIRSILLVQNAGYAAACNRGIKEGRAPYVVLMNSDLMVTPGWLEPLLVLMASDPAIAVCGPLLVNGEDRIVGAGTGFDFRMRAWGQRAEEISFQEPLLSLSVAGACYMLRRALLPSIGYLDEDYFFYFEDLDYSFRVYHCGYKVVFCPKSRVIHFFDHRLVHGGGAGKATEKEDWYKEGEALFNRKWSIAEGVIKYHGPIGDNSRSE